VSERAHIRYTKWDGSLHWHFDADVIASDQHGTWVAVPPGGTYRRGDETPRVDEHGFVVLVPDRGWWTAYFNAVPRGSKAHLVYVDINTAATWNGTTASMIDLDLDVTLAPGESARIIDEDEFDEHRVLWSYPPEVVDRVRTTAARIATQIDFDREPFASAGPGRVAQALGWSSGTTIDGDLGVDLGHRIDNAVAPPLDARVAIRGTVHPASITAIDPTVVLDCPQISPVPAGTPISVWVDPEQARYDVA
jgi:protein associated with RNAse G/E